MGHSRGGDVVTLTGFIGRLLYGVFFVVVVPLALTAWAARLAPVVPLPAPHHPAGGAMVAAVGLALLALGILDLIRRGHGLPMNAFPPRLFVRAGGYRWLRNPIYIGFGLIVAGAALARGSAAGLWVVAPVTALAMLALVWGYERHDLLARFGPSAMDPPLLSLPRPGSQAPTAAERAALYVWVLVPWLVAFYALQALGPAPDAFSTALPFERAWPVMPWTEAVYVSAYLFVPAAPLLARRADGLRRLAVSGTAATIVVTLAWLVVPVVATNRPFEAESAMGRLLAWEQAHSTGVAAFPAFHVLWALLVAELWADNGRVTGRVAWTVLGWAWALAIAVSTLTTSMHTVLEVAAAFALFVPLRDPEATREWTRRATEQLANSWREWHVGRVRVINYGVYAAAGAGTGVLLAGMASGAHPEAVVWVACCVLVGAGTWAQWLEGSSRLLRPFGWYGGVIGGTIGLFSSALAGVPVLPLICVRGAVHPDLGTAALPREWLLPRRPRLSGHRHPLRAPALARHEDRGPRERAAASDAALLHSRQRGGGARAPPAARTWRRRRPRGRALPRPERHRAVRRGVLPRRTTDAGHRRPAHLPVARHRPDGRRDRDDHAAVGAARRRVRGAVPAARRGCRRNGAGHRPGDGRGLSAVQPPLLAPGGGGLTRAEPSTVDTSAAPPSSYRAT
jgi:protein-S-isoprenylcysteine O-methyltransferase Ste14